MNKDAIVVRAANGVAEHFFCSSEEADAICDAGRKNGEGVVIFKMESKSDDAEIIYDVSSVKQDVEAAKEKLNSDLRILALMEKHNIPNDKDLRRSIYLMLKEDRENYSVAGLIRH